MFVHMCSNKNIRVTCTVDVGKMMHVFHSICNLYDVANTCKLIIISVKSVGRQKVVIVVKTCVR